MSGDSELTVVRDENGELTRARTAAPAVFADRVAVGPWWTHKDRGPLSRPVRLDGQSTLSDNVPSAPLPLSVPQRTVTVPACLGAARFTDRGVARRQWSLSE